MPTTDRRTEVSGGHEIDSVRKIPRIKIRRFSDQPRTYFDAKDMSDLAASIEEIGQQTPIVVKRITGDPKHDYELVDGERRWIACGMVGVETMLAWIKNVADSEEQFVSSVVGNFGRSGHTALEIAQAIDKIRKSKRMHGFSAGEQIARIAKIFARSEPWVYAHLAILRLHPEVQAMMAPTLPDDQRMSHTLGVFISSLHQDLQLEIAKEAIERKMNLNQARTLARQMAEEAGVRAGIGKKGRPPVEDWRRFEDFVNRTREGVDTFMVPVVQDRLKRRSAKDLAGMATELEQCVARLNQLRASIIGKPSGT